MILGIAQIFLELQFLRFPVAELAFLVLVASFLSQSVHRALLLIILQI